MAGPMGGSQGWQEKGFGLLRKRLEGQIREFVVADPSHYAPDSPIREYEYPPHFTSELHFERQLDWEDYYLTRAGLPAIGESGCIIFWLPLPPAGWSLPYAVNTRRELGCVIGLMEGAHRWSPTTKIQVVVGAQEGFSGLSEIQRSLSSKSRTKFPVYPTLEETIDAAATLIGV